MPDENMNTEYSSTDPDRTWRELLESAAALQEIVPDAILVGGSAAAYHARHRISLDHDHVVQRLRESFDKVLGDLEELSGWRTNRVRRPVLILGDLDGVDAGVRQIRRSRPLETQQVTTTGGKTLTLPTAQEATRIKIALLLQRKAVRDYLDVAALADHIGHDEAARAVLSMDSYYAPSDVRIPPGSHIAKEAIRMLSEPATKEPSPQETLDSLHLVDARYRSWGILVEICQKVAAHALRTHTDIPS